MIYREFKKEKLSLLGMGTMRLPTVAKTGEIDEPAAQKMVDTAIQNGINYFDTAWGYHDGAAEPFIGRALAGYPRKSFYLASKFPGYDLSCFGKHREIFRAQLEKCGVTYFDFYLMHNVCEMNLENYLRPGTVEFFEKQKENGAIRYLGFSSHGRLETMKRYLDVYADKMEFCQLQINYLDWEFQDAQKKLELLREYGLPVFIMEPLRGGRLVRLSEEEKKMLPSGMEEAECAFRFLQGIPDCKVILSGMSDEKQLLRNIELFSEQKPLSESDENRLFKLAAAMTEKTSVACTGCRYCTAHCPQGLNIPYLLELYNEHNFTKTFAFIAPMALAALGEEKQPGSCIACRSCEAVCPQQIRISEILSDFNRKLGE